MTHSDDEGLVLPPKLAPYQVVIIPFLNKKKEEQNEVLLAKATEIKKDLAQFSGVFFPICVEQLNNSCSF